MHRFTTADGSFIARHGSRMVKMPNPVYMMRQIEPFEVATNEGLLSGKAGDFAAYDPISGHVWPVSADYVAQHYRPEGPGETAAAPA